MLMGGEESVTERAFLLHFTLGTSLPAGGDALAARGGGDPRRRVMKLSLLCKAERVVLQVALITGGILLRVLSSHRVLAAGGNFKLCEKCRQIDDDDDAKTISVVHPRKYLPASCVHILAFTYSPFLAVHRFSFLLLLRWS